MRDQVCIKVSSKIKYKIKYQINIGRSVNHIFTSGAKSVNNSPHKRINYHKKIKSQIKTITQKIYEARGRNFCRDDLESGFT